MKWLKLDDGGLFNLESVVYIYADKETCAMQTVDGDAEWGNQTVRQVWEALQEPNAMVPPQVDWKCNCGKKHFDINLSKPFICACGLPFGTPRK